MLPALLAGAGLLGKLFGGGAKGAAAERGTRNDYQQTQNQQALSQFNTQQNALLQALLAQGSEASNRYNTRQGATTSALGQESQEATGRYNTRQGATQTALGQQSAEGLQRAQLGLNAPSVRARQGVMGSLMANLQPVKVEGGNPRLAGRVPQISGGLTPSALSADTRQQGGELAKAALMAQLTGSDVPAATNFRGGVLDAPKPTDFRSGVLDAPPATDYASGVMKPPSLQGFQQPGKGESIASFLSMLLNGAGQLGSLKKPYNPLDETGGG